MTLQHVYGALELRAEGDGRTVVGLAVPYGVTTPDSPAGPERFAANAFKRSIGMRKSNPLKVFRNHDHGAPVGLASLTNSDGGVSIETRIAETPLGDQVLSEVRAKLLDHFSIGFNAIRERVVDGVREILEGALHEVSLVALPAYSDAKVLSLRGVDGMELPPRPEAFEGSVVIGGVRWG